MKHSDLFLMYVLVFLLPSELPPFLLPLRPPLTLAPVEQPALQECVASARRSSMYSVNCVQCSEPLHKYLPDVLIVELVPVPGKRLHLALAQPHSPGGIIRN